MAQKVQSTSDTNQQTIASNCSVDRIVFQVEQVSGLINDLVISAKQRVDGVLARGQNSLDGFSKQFSTGKQEVDYMLSVIDVKTRDFPLVAFYVLLIMILIIILASLLHLLTTGSAQVAGRYYRMKAPRITQTV